MGRGLLLLVSGFLIIVGIVQKNMNDRLQLLPERAINYHEEMNAQNISNSLLEYGIRELDNNQNWEAGFASANYMDANVSLEVFTHDDYINDNPGIPSDHSIDNWDEYTILLVSTAETEAARAITEVAITKDAFSKYTYFSDTEPSHIYFFDDDVLTGPVHTNGTLRIAGSPLFEGFVSSPNAWQGHSSYNNDPQFEGGFNFSSPVIDMPGPDELSYLRDEGIANGLTFNERIFVEFKDNGTVDISGVSGSDSNPTFGEPQNYNLNAINGIISSSRKVYTKGTLKGSVTLHSSDEVEIMGDLTYSTHPSNQNSTDLLGIVSEGDVKIDRYAHEDSGTQDLEIHASIMTLDRSFEVEDYSSGDPRGELTLIGGLQQKERGAVGTFNGGGVQSGFSKSYSYDERLSKMIPPFYPRESIYSQKYWKEKPVENL